jgi:hypothetical protein
VIYIISKVLAQDLDRMPISDKQRRQMRHCVAMQKFNCKSVRIDIYTPAIEQAMHSG